MDYHELALHVLKEGTYFPSCNDVATDCHMLYINDGGNPVLTSLTSGVSVKFDRFTQFGGALFQAITGSR